MANIRIERTPIKKWNLGMLGFTHLQIVYEPSEGAAQDIWWVYEGLRLESPQGVFLGAEGVGGRTTLSEANEGLAGADLVAALGTPAQRSSRILLSGDTLQVWEDMDYWAGEIDAQLFPYIGFGVPISAWPTLNSSSVVASLLYYGGLDPQASLPTDLGISPGTTTLIGSTEGEHLVMEKGFTTLVGGAGRDIFTGRNTLTDLDRFYGGADGDFFHWSKGRNIYHGGQPKLEYKKDGEDTIGYYGAGEVRITKSDFSFPHLLPDYLVTTTTSRDELYSIERIEWDAATDHIILGEGVLLHEDGIFFDFGAEGGDKGDQVDMSQTSDGLIINASIDAIHHASLLEPVDGAQGAWFEDLEWIVASQGGDVIYAGSGIKGVEGGKGDDLIDVRLAEAFSGASPLGYDVEVDGGEGADTIVSGPGRTFVKGGTGSDQFVLSGVTSGSGPVELVIADAEDGDRLYVPHNYFRLEGGGYEGSELMPLLGAMGRFEDMGGPDEPLVFEWLTEEQLYSETSNDRIQGVIEFVGAIRYYWDGPDLLVALYQGYPAETPQNLIVAEIEFETETIIRIKDFQLGDLGLVFHDPGIPEDSGASQGWDAHPNWDAAVAAMTNGGTFKPALDARPVAPGYDVEPDGSASQRVIVNGSEDDDVIEVSSASEVDAGGGNDQVNGSSGDDVIDGGAGADTMNGGAGNDDYVVDSAGDVVVEAHFQGADTVMASIDYALGENIEHLTLAGAALEGTGNALANRLGGNDLDNVLMGLDGADALHGGLGNDVLIGGPGADGYVYFAGDGNDTIADQGDAGSLDRILLVGIAPDDVTMLRLATNPDDLALSFASGGRITLSGYFTPAGRIERIDLAGDITWDDATIGAMADAVLLLANDPPVAVDDQDYFVRGGSFIIEAAGLMENDESHDGDPLSLVAVSNVSVGTASIDAAGDIAFVMPDGYEGIVAFDYTISDGNGATSTAHASFFVEPNAAPVVLQAVSDQQANEAAPASFALPTGLFGDPDGDLIYIAARLADGSPLPSWLSFDPASGGFTGTPPVGSAGQIEIAVTADDGWASATVAFSLLIGSANVAPVGGVDGGFTVEAGETLVIPVAALFANDTDADGDALSIAAVSGEGISLDGGGNVIVQPAPGAAGEASFSYALSDGRGGVSVVNVAYTVEPQRDGVTIAGTGAAESHSGTGLNDTFLVIGDGGLDQVDGGVGFDRLEGSIHADVIRVASGLANLSGLELIDGKEGADRIEATAGSDVLDFSALVLRNIEKIDGGAGNDTIIGSAGADHIYGGTGNDVLAGGAGADTFYVVGDGGLDLVEGGAGADTIRGSVYNDVVRVAGISAGFSGIETIDLGEGVDRIEGGGADDSIDLSNVTLSGVEKIDGGLGNDHIIGSAGHDVIVGGGGDDLLEGGDGDDVFGLAGDGGLDVVIGGAGFDRIVGSAYNDVIRITSGMANIIGVELIDGGAGIDRIEATAGNDIIDLAQTTLVGIERIVAGTGHDWIRGSAAGESLTGGAGNDVFVFAAGGGHDTVTDFHLGSSSAPLADVVDLTAAGFADFAAVLESSIQSGSDTVISLDANSSVRLTGIALAALKADDVLI